MKTMQCPYVSPVVPCSNFSSFILLSSPDFVLPSNVAVNDQYSMFLDCNYPSCLPLYTDGSRLETGSVSVALFISSLGLSFSWLLNPAHSVMGAELFAILQALRFIRDDGRMSTSKIVVLSDCMSALCVIQEIAKPRYNAFCYEIQQLLVEFAGRVVLQWVPSHCGIDGNEVADRVAFLCHDNNSSVRTVLNYEELPPLLRK